MIYCNELVEGPVEERINKWCAKVTSKKSKISGGVLVDHVYTRGREMPEDMGDVLYRNLLARL
jgi:hypothetical protein